LYFYNLLIRLINSIAGLELSSNLENLENIAKAVKCTLPKSISAKI